MSQLSRLVNESNMQATINSLTKYCSGMTFTLSGTTLTLTQVIAFFVSALNASVAVTAAEANYRAALAAEKANTAQTGKLVREARDMITLMFEGVPATLAAFQIPTPKARKPLSAEARAAANAKASATRKARGTASKKQKAQIHGAVTGVTITPVTSSGTGAALLPTVPTAPSTPVTPVGVGVTATGTAHS
jgi:hypothetical protein